VDQIAAGMGHKLEIYHRDFFYHYLKVAGLPIRRTDIKVGVTFPLDSNRKGDTMVEVDLLADTPEFVFAAEVTSHLELDEVPKVERFIKIFNHIKASQMGKRAFGEFQHCNLRGSYIRFLLRHGDRSRDLCKSESVVGV